MRPRSNPSVRSVALLALALSPAPLLPAQEPATLSAREIADRSALATRADWNTSPSFDFCETNRTDREDRTYAVLMISGYPYRRLVGVDGRALTSAEEAAAAQHYAAVLEQRQHEATDERRKHIAQYEKERNRDQSLLHELTRAMDFTLAGTGTLASHDVYILDANPRKGYVPTSAATSVLTGMRGRLWVDKSSFRWVKVEAEVFRPVMIEGFIARVERGTHFSLQLAPIQGAEKWLPTHFAMEFRARVLFLFPKSGREESTYSRYRPNGALTPTSCQPLAKE